MKENMKPYSDKLQCWFNLSYASYLTLPRVLMEAMPQEWQDKMADLLFEWDKTYRNWPDGISTRVQITKNGRLTKTPDWLLNYRHPDLDEIERIKS